MLLALALRIRLEWHKDNSLIRRAAGKTEARNRKRSLSLRHIAQQLRNLFPNRFGVFQGCTGGRLNDDNKISLVFVWDESTGNAREHKISQPQTGEKQNNHCQLVIQNVVHDATVTARDRRHSIVKLLQPPPFLAVGTAQENRRQHWSQGKRVERRNGN